MKASLTLVGGVVALSLFALYLSYRWYTGDETGCELNWMSGGVQLGCGSTLVTPTMWCEAQWAFVSMGYPPSGYCLWLP